MAVAPGRSLGVGAAIDEIRAAYRVRVALPARVAVGGAPPPMRRSATDRSGWSVRPGTALPPVGTGRTPPHWPDADAGNRPRARPQSARPRGREWYRAF